MVGLIDCNNFFVSCERVFRPELARKPVIVLSNNDGCAVAMSNEAKALGIKRGVPVFQIREEVMRHGIAVISGNHKLYGDLSSRVMATVGSIVPDIEIYSIDECFFRLPDNSLKENERIAREIVKKVRRDVGIPTSIGVASTKTLSKVAARQAKKDISLRSVCLLGHNRDARSALANTDISDVWGIGRRLTPRLNAAGIETALQFADTPIHKVRELLNVNGEKTWRELNGEPCEDFEPVEPDKKQICNSRSFSQSIGDIEQLREAMAWFCDNISRRLRKQNGCALTLTVFIQTNSFRPDQPQHFGTATIRLDEATADTLIMTKAAISLLNSIFRKGYTYKRAGVRIDDIVSKHAVQQNLFAVRGDRTKRDKLMSTIDSINRNEETYDKLHCGTYTSNLKRVNSGTQNTPGKAQGITWIGVPLQL